MKIAIVIPTYNEKLNIHNLLKEIKKNINVSLVVIVDDSPDKSIENEILDFTDIVKYIYRGSKLGRGSAVLNGMNFALNEAKCDVVIEMDADLSHDPSELKNNLELFKKNQCDLLISSKYQKDSKIINWPVSRYILSFIANKLTRLVLSIPVSDYTNGYRIYSNNAANHILKSCGKVDTNFIMLSEILMEIYYNNFKVCETKSVFRNRVRGESNVNFKLIISSLLGLFRLFKIKNTKYKNFKKNK